MVLIILDYTLNGILKKIFKKTVSLIIKNMGILNVPPPMTPHRFRGVYTPHEPAPKDGVIIIDIHKYIGFEDSAKWLRDILVSFFSS